MFESHGVVSRTSEQVVEITELPYGVWTESYKSYLSDRCRGTGHSIRMQEDHTSQHVHFTLTATKEVWDNIISSSSSDGDGARQSPVSQQKGGRDDKACLLKFFNLRKKHSTSK